LVFFCSREKMGAFFALAGLPGALHLLILLIVLAWGVAYAFPTFIEPLKIKLGFDEKLINVSATLFYLFAMVGMLIAPAVGAGRRLLFPVSVATGLASGYIALGWILVSPGVHRDSLPLQVLAFAAFAAIGVSTGILYSHTYSVGLSMMATVDAKDKDAGQEGVFAGHLNVAYGLGAVSAMVISTRLGNDDGGAAGDAAAAKVGWFVLGLAGLQLVVGAIFLAGATAARGGGSTGGGDGTVATQPSSSSSQPAVPAAMGNAAAAGLKPTKGPKEVDLHPLSGTQIMVSFLRQPINWVLFFAYFLKVGLGAAITVNLVPILDSVSSTHSDVILPVFMAGQLLGRMIMVAVFARSPQSKITPESVNLLAGDPSNAVTLRDHSMQCKFILRITGFLACGYAVWFAAAAMSLGSAPAIEVLTVVFSLLYGMVWPLNPELLKCGKGWTMAGAQHWPHEAAVALPWGGLGAILMGLFTGALFDLHAHKDNNGNDACLGTACFQTAFFVLAGCSVALLVAIVIIYMAGEWKTAGSESQWIPRFVYVERGRARLNPEFYTKTKIEVPVPVRQQKPRD
jgi:hypothetical protein